MQQPQSIQASARRELCVLWEYDLHLVRMRPAYQKICLFHLKDLVLEEAAASLTRRPNSSPLPDSATNAALPFPVSFSSLQVSSSCPHCRVETLTYYVPSSHTAGPLGAAGGSGRLGATQCTQRLPKGNPHLQIDPAVRESLLYRPRGLDCSVRSKSSIFLMSRGFPSEVRRAHNIASLHGHFARLRKCHLEIAKEISCRLKTVFAPCYCMNA